MDADADGGDDDDDGSCPLKTPNGLQLIWISISTESFLLASIDLSSGLLAVAVLVLVGGIVIREMVDSYDECPAQRNVLCDRC